MITASYDFSNLRDKLSGLAGALVGRGAGEGDIQQCLRVEAGQCAWKIAQSLGPGTHAQAAKRLNSDIHQYFSDKPTYSNLDVDQQYSSTSDFTWLAAGPNFLVGINDEDNQTGISADEAVKTYYENKNIGPRGNAWERVGTRGKQAVMRLNRIRIRPGTMNGMRRAIEARFGQSKAAFARTAVHYLKRSFPNWVTRAIPDAVLNGKSILSEIGLRSTKEPFLEFGSRAPGVTSNPRMVAAIQAGAKWSEITLAAKCRKVIAGQIYNWNTGQIFPPSKVEDK